MPFGFYIIMAAQFFSALADHAIFILAIFVLRDPNIGGAAAAEEFEPLLKFSFSFFYVALAAFVGAFADSMPKWRVMLISNTIKIGGCFLMLMGAHPVVAYGIIGLGAAAYSPAKYGILTEYLPHRLLVLANGWIEGLTVGAIILGMLLGGWLTNDGVMAWFAQFDIPLLGDSVDPSIAVIGLLYLLAAVFNLYIPDTGVDHKPLRANPLYLLRDFGHSLSLLWRDKLGQISLSATTLVWGIAGTMQVLVLKWAEVNLGREELSKQTNMLAFVAIGMTIGAILASRFVRLSQSVKIFPVGMLMGLILLCMPIVTNINVAIFILILIGICGGFFVVPMNALLQHRGHVLMGAGHSISVQNFNENLSTLTMNGLYACLIFMNVHINYVLIFFGLLAGAALWLIQRWHKLNQKRHNVMSQLEGIH
ncbi:MAG: lysophospholipid transporter LplT [Azoarcus sp.]|jgi:MFS family permease|nr:lysophospholipid transporter LplT [Azoarcus sp.]